MMDKSAKHWYLLTSKPHKDALAEHHLVNQGYSVYRPLAQRLRTRRGKQETVIESLFPRYMFIELNRLDDNWAPIRSTIGVQGFVRFGEMPTPVPLELINYLHMNESTFSERAIDLDRFHTGDKVIIKDGPFKGITGIFQNYDGEQRAIILLEILRKATSLKINPTHVMAA
ncbi:MAG: transcription/translation regulatory transformer protein RfaH [Thiofilum sp.]|uniref:transcription/translation regulatory transformer protein RfaH n=1 Tax=Thiofilum sp. TaxID=2212733 RepID=UPI0025F5C20C|nr:transcription/translation regulatory transformer protein RfaH [Thiofilum sp.]MBK8453101.1 transcription/translation regulatory transformer protein RfaH [Thiofilum sp.]